MNNEYKELVRCVREDYKTRKSGVKEIELGWCDRDKDDDLCREINLWTYWQGWQYAQNTPHIRILLLGQDWGNPYSGQDTGVISNVRRMNNGEDIPYLYNYKKDAREAKTDTHIVELFDAIDYKNIDEKRYSDLFFSNFCLGYRTGQGSQGMTKTIMKRDEQYVRRLIDILKPEKILCLGSLVTSATTNLLLGKAAPKYSNYNAFVDEYGKGIEYHGQTFTSKIYPLFHPGYYGVLNRKGGWDKHLEDWKNIISDKGE
jgi:hypothetical protein